MPCQSNQQALLVVCFHVARETSCQILSVKCAHFCAVPAAVCESLPPVPVNGAGYVCPSGSSQGPYALNTKCSLSCNPGYASFEPPLECTGANTWSSVTCTGEVVNDLKEYTLQGQALPTSTAVNQSLGVHQTTDGARQGTAYTCNPASQGFMQGFT